MDTETMERERVAAELFYGMLIQNYALAPEGEATWLVCRALLPDAERHLRTLGWRPPLSPEDAAGLPPRHL